MAIKELFSLVQTTVDIDRTTPVDIYAGQCIVLSSAGQATLALRNSTVTALYPSEFVGLAADDAARTGNTFIQSDPVGSTKVAADGTITASNNAFFVSTKRALGDYQDETVSNVSDLNSGSTGYQGPRRGLSVYNYTPGTQFILDSKGVAFYYTTAAGTDAADTANAASWIPGMMLTIGGDATYTKGKLVRSTTPGTNGKPVARLDKLVGTAGSASALYYITLV